MGCGPWQYRWELGRQNFVGGKKKEHRQACDPLALLSSSSHGEWLLHLFLLNLGGVAWPGCGVALSQAQVDGTLPIFD